MDAAGRWAPRVTAVLVVPLVALSFIAWSMVQAEDEPEVDNPHGELEDTCDACHSDNAWLPAVISPRFDHSRFFQLRSAHMTTECMSCHRTLIFKGESQLCVSCHEDVHRGELGSDCERCHTTRSFIERVQMRREHQLTRFPLRGSHAAVECEECHSIPGQGQMIYVNRDVECESCHLDDYLATSSPNHVQADFPETCDQCHNTVFWEQARMAGDLINHDGQFFPIFSGSHNNAWTACNECHVSQANYSNFSCILCHEHGDPQDMAEKHSSVDGYSFNTGDCFSCHPQGEI